jgi:hypothetical protein
MEMRRGREEETTGCLLVEIHHFFIFFRYAHAFQVLVVPDGFKVPTNKQCVDGIVIAHL